MNSIFFEIINRLTLKVIEHGDTTLTMDIDNNGIDLSIQSKINDLIYERKYIDLSQSKNEIIDNLIDFEGSVYVAIGLLNP